MPNEFFTIQSMMTLAGATGATLVVANGIQVAFNFNPKWLALAIAEAISIVGAVYSVPAGQSLGFAHFFVGLVNGFLIFCTAVGGNGVVGHEQPPAARDRGADEAARPQPEPGRRRFFTPWL